MLYHVSVHGTGLTLDGGDGKQEVGFYRNLFIWALSERSAIESAFDGIREDIEALANVSVTPETGLVLEVDAIHASLAFWRAFFRQGFIFYPRDK